MACTEKQQIANARNAQKSTGPRSVGGKDRTRYNALKHGLRCDLTVIPGEDPAQYEAELGAWLAEWGPQDVTRMRLVEKGMRSTWRLARIFRAENALYANLALERRRLLWRSSIKSIAATSATGLKRCFEKGRPVRLWPVQ